MIDVLKAENMAFDEIFVLPDKFLDRKNFAEISA
jgi:hypothetical protein